MLTEIVVVRIILDIYGMDCLEPEEGVRISNGTLSKNSKKSLSQNYFEKYLPMAGSIHQKYSLKTYLANRTLNHPSVCPSSPV